MRLIPSGLCGSIGPSRRPSALVVIRASKLPVWTYRLSTALAHVHPASGWYACIRPRVSVAVPRPSTRTPTSAAPSPRTTPKSVPRARRRVTPAQRLRSQPIIFPPGPDGEADARHGDRAAL